MSDAITNDDAGGDSDDLYDDLHHNSKMAVIASASHAVSATLSTPSFRPSSLTSQVESLTAQVQQLSTENETLRRNMGILFRTARTELQRKDDEIQRLQTLLDGVQATAGEE